MTTVPTQTAWKSFRSSKWFKPVIAAAIVAVLLFAALLALPVLIDINTYRSQITSQLEQKLGRKVKLGALGLRVLPSVKVRVDELQISDDPQFAALSQAGGQAGDQAGEFVKAKSVRLQLGLWNLLRGNPQVSGLELIEPEVTLIKTKENDSDKWNWSTLKALQTSGEQNAEQAAFDLRITNGSFKLIDRTATTPVEKLYTGVNAALDNFSPRQSFDFVIGLAMPGQNAGKLELKGAAGPMDSKDSAQTPIDARVKMDQVELASIEALLGMQTPHAGKLTLDAEIAGKLADGLTASGQIKAEQLRLIDGVEPARVPLETKFKLTAKSEKKPTPENAGQTEIVLKLEQCDVTLGKTAASVTGQINRLPVQPTFDLQLKGDRMALDSLLESAYAFGFGPPPGTKASGAATLKVHAIGDQNNYALNGQAEIRELKFQSAQLPQAIQISELKLSFDPQTITAAPFRSTLSRTTVDFKGVKLSDYGQSQKWPRLHLEIATEGAQLDDLLKIAESFGARPDATGSGTASLAATMDADFDPKSTATQITGQGKLTGARLQSSQLKKPLEIANADLRFTGDSARIDNLQAQFGSSQANGWLQIKNFNQPAASFDLKANQLNLAELQQAMADGGKGQTKKSSSAPLRADGQISVGKLVLDTITATDVQGTVAMANNVITLSPVTVKLYNGSYQGAFRVDQSQAVSDISLTGKFSGLDINQFLSASGKSSSIYGRAEGSIDVRGRNEANGLAETLIGNGYIAINDGKFASFDLMKQVEVLGKLVNLPTGGAGSAFRSLKTNLKFDRGKMTTDALQLLMDDMQVTGDGWMQLGEAPTVSYDLLTKLSAGLTKRVMSGSSESGGSRLPINLGVGLSSVVGNFFMEQGALTVPIKMSGSLKQPVFGLNSAMLQSRAKERLKENILEQFNKKDDAKPGETKSEDKKPGGLLKGVLDKLRPKEKP